MLLFLILIAPLGWGRGTRQCLIRGGTAPRSNPLAAKKKKQLYKGSLRADEIKLWLTPSAKQRRNPCSGLPPVYPDLSTRHDWPVKKGLCFVCRDRQSG